MAAAALNKFLQWSSLSDLFSGAVGASVEHGSKFRAQSFRLFNAAGQAGNLARNATNPAFAARFRQIQLDRINKATVAQFQSNGNVLLRQANRLPNYVKARLGENFGQFVRGTGQIARFARPVLGKIPVLGVAITAASVANTAANGGDWKREAISGTASLAAGIIVGTAIGGPIGFVVGAAVGFGVGYIIDNHEAIGAAIGDAANAVGHAAAAAGNAVADGIGKLGKALFG